MYHDMPQRVTLLCENRTMRNIIDHFGEDVDTEVVDANHFRATVDVAPTPPFFSWVFTFGGRYPHRGAWGGAGEDAGYGLVAAYIKARGIRPGNAGQIPLTFTGQEDRCGVYPRSGPPDFSPKSIPACQWM